MTAARGRGLLWVIALTAALLSVGPRPSRAETTAEYRARLDRWAGMLADARRQVAERDPTWQVAVQEVSGEASQDREVTRECGEPISVEHRRLAGHLDEALRAPGPQRAAAALRTGADQLDAYRAALGPGPAYDPARVRAIVARMLPVASTRRVNLDWLRKIFERLLQWVEELFTILPDIHGGTSRTLAYIALGLAASVLAAALFLAGRALLRRFAPYAAGHQPDIEIALRGAASPDPDSLLDRSRRTAARGDYREAIRLLYLALIWKLNFAGLVEYHPATTNWEYLRSLRDGQSRPPLESLTTIFDRICYGAARAAQPDYEECERLFDSVLAGAGVP